MTSWVLSLVFLASLVSSVPTADPANLKSRITVGALEMLTDRLQMLTDELLLNRPFNYAEDPKCTSNLTITQLTIHQANLRFHNSGLQLQIQNADVTVRTDPKIRCLGDFVPDAKGMKATVDVKLSRDKSDRLKPDLTCKVGWKRPGKGAILTTTLKAVCFFLKRRIQRLVNTMSATIPMSYNLSEEFNILLDYSLARNPEVTPTHLDLSFKGVAHRMNQNPDLKNHGLDPVFSQSSHMFYMGVSEPLFSSTAKAFFDAGAKKKINFKPADIAARFIHFIRSMRLSAWNDNLSTAVELTEVPTINITEEGLDFTMRSKVVASAEPAQNVFSIPVMCRGRMKVSVEGTQLVLPENTVRCDIVTENRMLDFLVSGVNWAANYVMQGYFRRGVPIPLPEGINFAGSNPEIRYNQGFMVLGASLAFNRDWIRNLKNLPDNGEADL